MPLCLLSRFYHLYFAHLASKYKCRQILGPSIPVLVSMKIYSTIKFLIVDYCILPILGKPAFQLVLDPAPAARSADRDIGRNRGAMHLERQLYLEKGSKEISYHCGSVSGWVMNS